MHLVSRLSQRSTGRTMLPGLLPGLLLGVMPLLAACGRGASGMGGLSTVPATLSLSAITNPVATPPV